MNRTNIEWTDWTYNPITGCLNTCSYCYARKMAENPFYHKAFPFGFKPMFYPERLDEPRKAKPGAKIFVCSMGELFGDYPEWTSRVFETIRRYPKLTFQLLTKQPQNLAKWSPFPQNCWVGVSVDGTAENSLSHALYTGLNRVSTTVKFLSFEPLLGEIRLDPRDLTGEMLGESHNAVDWLIIGACTGAKAEILEIAKSHPALTPMATDKQNRWIAAPPIDWIRKIVEAADKAGVPVFLKDNLNVLFSKNACELFQDNKELLFALKGETESEKRYHLRQEYPR